MLTMEEIEAILVSDMCGEEGGVWVLFAVLLNCGMVKCNCYLWEIWKKWDFKNIKQKVISWRQSTQLLHLTKLGIYDIHFD